MSTPPSENRTQPCEPSISGSASPGLHQSSTNTHVVLESTPEMTTTTVLPNVTSQEHSSTYDRTNSPSLPSLSGVNGADILNQYLQEVVDGGHGNMALNVAQSEGVDSGSQFLQGAAVGLNIDSSSNVYSSGNGIFSTVTSHNSGTDSNIESLLNLSESSMMAFMDDFYHTIGNIEDNQTPFCNVPSSDGTASHLQNVQYDMLSQASNLPSEEADNVTHLSNVCDINFDPIVFQHSLQSENVVSNDNKEKTVQSFDVGIKDADSDITGHGVEKAKRTESPVFEKLGLKQGSENDTKQLDNKQTFDEHLPRADILVKDTRTGSCVIYGPVYNDLLTATSSEDSIFLGDTSQNIPSCNAAEIQSNELLTEMQHNQDNNSLVSTDNFDDNVNNMLVTARDVIEMEKTIQENYSTVVSDNVHVSDNVNTTGDNVICDETDDRQETLRQRQTSHHPTTDNQSLFESHTGYKSINLSKESRTSSNLDNPVTDKPATKSAVTPDFSQLDKTGLLGTDGDKDTSSSKDSDPISQGQPFLPSSGSAASLEEEDSELMESDAIAIPSTVEDVAAMPATSEVIQTVQKKKPSETLKRYRPKVPASEKDKTLWQFLLDTLSDPGTNPSVLCWIDRGQGVFQITDSDRLSQMWAQSRKRQIEAKSEFLTRSLRHYYTKDIMQRVPSKKQAYKFGGKVDWMQYLQYAEKMKGSGSVPAEKSNLENVTQETNT